MYLTASHVSEHAGRMSEVCISEPRAEVRVNFTMSFLHNFSGIFSQGKVEGGLEKNCLA